MRFQVLYFIVILQFCLFSFINLHFVVCFIHRFCDALTTREMHL